MEEQRGISFGSVLAAFATLMFLFYLGYAISKKRRELRETIELLTEDHGSFVDGLEALVASGELCAIA